MNLNKLKKANARASVKNQKFQEELQEQQAKDIEEMDRLDLTTLLKLRNELKMMITKSVDFIVLTLLIMNLHKEKAYG